MSGGKSGSRQDSCKPEDRMPYNMQVVVIFCIPYLPRPSSFDAETVRSRRYPLKACQMASRIAVSRTGRTQHTTWQRANARSQLRFRPRPPGQEVIYSRLILAGQHGCRSHWKRRRLLSRTVGAIFRWCCRYTRPSRWYFIRISCGVRRDTILCSARLRMSSPSSPTPCSELAPVPS